MRLFTQLVVIFTPALRVVAGAKIWRCQRNGYQRSLLTPSLHPLFENSGGLPLSPLGVSGVQCHQIIDIDEKGFYLK